MMYGMPFPGDYLIAPDGTVRDKLFLPSYEHRPSASQVVLRHFGDDADGNSVRQNQSRRADCDSEFVDRSLLPRAGIGGIAGHTSEAGLAYLRRASSSTTMTKQRNCCFDGLIVGEQALELPPSKPMLLKKWLR